MNLRLRAYPDRGPIVWFALTGGIAAWAVHLVFFSAVVRYVHNTGDFWLFHAGNATCLFVALVATALSWDMYRQGRDDEGAGTPEGRIRFLGILGLVVNGVNILLIVAEGSLIYFLKPGG